MGSESRPLHILSSRNVLRLIEYLMSLSFSNRLHRDAPPLALSFPPLIPHPRVVFVRASVGVCSAWAVGGVVVMESVLRDLWAGLQDANQEV